MTKYELIEIAKDRNHLIDESRRIYFKEVVYFGNPLAPEAVAYRFYYWDIFGVRKKFTFYPETVGFQGMH